MSEEPEMEKDDDQRGSLKGKIPGAGQFLIGELETIGGVLTGDPLAQAEGEFNVEVGSVREEIEDDLQEAEHKRSE